MASVNKIIIVGNLGREPELRTMPNGDQLANVSIATTDKWKDKQTGEAREATEWHRVVFNGRLAEIVGQYLTKGSQVYVEGSLRTRKWTDTAGVEKFSTEIRADQMQMLGSRQDVGQQPYTPAPQRQQQQPQQQQQHTYGQPAPTGYYAAPQQPPQQQQQPPQQQAQPPQQQQQQQQAQRAPLPPKWDDQDIPF